jgi:ribosome-associated toxin RatA of RatAB toxin-antitoxin module
MKTIKHQIEIATSQEELFDITQNYDIRLDWDPYLKEAYLLDGAEKVDLGVESFCRNNSGSIMISKYISYKRPAVAAVTMVAGPKILKRFSGAWNVKIIAPNKSLLIFTYNFELRGWILDRLFQPVASLLFQEI